jgi:hypothetical protein
MTQLYNIVHSPLVEVVIEGSGLLSDFTTSSECWMHVCCAVIAGGWSVCVYQVIN